MEEDIKILEQLMITLEIKHLGGGKELANLIKGYRELENKSEEQAKFIENIQDNMGHKGMTKTELAFVCASLEYDNKELEEDLKNSIPKSKVKEKIEEINSELEEKYSAEKISVFSGNTYMEKFKLLGKLQALQELMEG